MTDGGNGSSITEKSIDNVGNSYRIKRVMEKATKGESVSIGFIGGSITQGALATDAKLSYAYRVFSWWQKCTGIS